MLLFLLFVFCPYVNTDLVQPALLETETKIIISKNLDPIQQVFSLVQDKFKKTFHETGHDLCFLMISHLGT